MTTSALHDALFSDVAGYSLSALGKAAIGRDGDPALTYGECTPEAVETILTLVKAKPGEVFYDLGSGTGKMVVYAAFLVPFKKSAGIELIKELHDAAEMIGHRYRTEVQPQLEDARRETVLEYRMDDIFTTDYFDADIVVNHCCTCFDDALMQRFSDTAESCKPGTRIVTITRTLNSPAFELVESRMVPMGWGQATANVYIKR